MAVLLYTNGLTEELKSKDLTFKDEELLKIFSDYDKLRTFRLYEVPNTWCVWGEFNPQDKTPDLYNQIGTDILDQACYSPILFIHDTEVDPSWNLTDVMILSGYDDFRSGMLRFFNDIAADMTYARQKMKENSKGNSWTQLELKQTGVSADKRIIHKFDLDDQVQNFYSDENLLDFAKRVHNFLKFSYKDGDIFAIYADTNIIIVMEDAQVKIFIEKLIAFFEARENYEACSVLRNTYERWIEWKNNKAKQIPPQPESDNESPNEEEPRT